MRFSTSMRLLAVLAFMFFSGRVTAQKTVPQSRSAYEKFVRQLRETNPGDRIVCYSSGKSELSSILPPAEFLRNRAARKAATSTFKVTYVNFPDSARLAFQYAVDIWASLISSPVPINIRATWTNLGGTTLGSAAPNEYRVGPDGSQKDLGIYGIALAEKIARRGLNHPDSADIRANFNRNRADWYYKLDARPPANKIDLVSVVLHEIGHGLGFISFARVPDGGTTASFESRPTVLDHFLENQNGQKMLDEAVFPSFSNQLYQLLVGNNLFFNGPVLQQRTGQKAKMFAPSTYNPGSSISHLDETTYPAGSINSLMTPSSSLGEAVHNPGPITLAMFADMEWKTTSVLHTPLRDSETVTDLAFRTRVVSDTTFNAGSVQLFYRKGPPPAGNPGLTTVPMTRVGTTEEFVYTLPAASASGDIWYYISAQDVAGRTYTNPGKAADGSQLYNRAQFGPDNVAPTIRLTQVNYVLTPVNYLLTTAAEQIPVYAKISDNRLGGLSLANVEYQVVKGGTAGTTQTVPLTRFVAERSDSVYRGQLNFVPNFFAAGDQLRYRVVARDSAATRNQAVSPATGFYTINLVAPKPTVDSYSNTFANVAASAADFAGNSFTISTPTGFPDPSINTEHPYANGTDFDDRSNYTYLLLSPIRVKANPDSAVIRFNEIVLVEPNERSAEFGTRGFFDYVTVEGSTNGGKAWYPLVDPPYNSRANSAWLSAYNAGVPSGGQDSNAPGTPALYRARTIRITENGNFRAGDVMLIRFRLFADQLAFGWGWSIDNLAIQTPPAPPVLAVEPITAGTFNVYPNPTVGLIRVEAGLSKAIAEAGLSVVNQTGQTLRQIGLKPNGTQINETVDLGSLPAGLYFLKLNAGETVLTRKVIVTK
jgi:hypothetical protein